MNAVKTGMNPDTTTVSAAVNNGATCDISTHLGICEPWPRQRSTGKDQATMPRVKRGEPIHRNTPTGFDFRYDKALTPAKAIRAQCLHCTCGQVAEIRNCTATPDKCNLHPYRMGHGCDRSRDPHPPSRRKAMRHECILCMGGYRDLLRTCTSFYCPLWPYRLGHGICTDPDGNRVTHRDRPKSSYNPPSSTAKKSKEPQTTPTQGDHTPPATSPPFRPRNRPTAQASRTDGPGCPDAVPSPVFATTATRRSTDT